MKTLCLSLLRLGDFFHHVHILNGIEGEVHILAFDEVKPAEKLFPQYTFHFIDRGALQFELVENHRNWKRAVYLLGQDLKKLNKNKFDRVLNLTHTTFAARILDLVTAPEKTGLHFDNGKVHGWNPILKYINDIWREEDAPLMNWVDVTALSLGLQEPAVMTANTNTNANEIWLQPLTSDKRKNWDLANWLRLASLLNSSGFKARVIGAKSEEAELAPIFGELFTALSFQEMREQKDNCRLLVSGDTSVLHFAVLEQIPVHSIFLGPANPYKTPPRQLNALVWSEINKFSVHDVAGACLADIQGIDLSRAEEIPFGRINNFGRLSIRSLSSVEGDNQKESHGEKFGRVFTESLGSARASDKLGSQDSGI